MAKISIEQGELKGAIGILSSGREFYSFKGIPYGESPVGELRFKAPRPAGKWNGIRDATEHGPQCPQINEMTKEIIDGGENCLSLNVYTPKINTNPAAVMVWFHGGGFRSGSGDSPTYGPEYLLEEDVIVVTVNYRLEVLGFLNLNTDEVPGNAGMKDQVLALKWVRDNIRNFGGDPDNVTIFGESAGGASVTYHLVSPMSKGLFHRMIAQSGCFLNDWALSYDTVERAFKLGKYLGCDTSDTDVLLKFFRSLTTDKFLDVTMSIANEIDKLSSIPLYFCPSIEKKIPGQESFMPKHPLDLLNEGNFNKVPVLIGYNNSEALLYIKNLFEKSDMIQKNFIVKIPRDISMAASESNLKKIGNEIRKFYYGDKLIGKETIGETLDMESDFMFIYGILKFAKIIARASPFPVYLYRFSADGELNFLKEYSGFTDVKGAAHGDELFYLFKTWLEIKNGSDEWTTMKRITQMWTNFAIYGDPTMYTTELIPIKWQPVTSTEMKYMEINFDLKMLNDPEKERYDFWNRLYNLAQDSNTIKSSL